MGAELLPLEEIERGPREYCGVFGIYLPEKAQIGANVYLGLHSLQHRGQDAAGIALNSDDGIYVSHGEGLLSQAFSETTILGLGEATIGTGHVRYPTSDDETTPSEIKVRATQPIYKGIGDIEFALAVNGNLEQAPQIAEELGIDYKQMASDTDLLAEAILQRAQVVGDVEKAAMEVLERFADNAFSLTLMTHDKLIVARDPRGFRPLVWGKFSTGGYAVASEIAALDIVGVVDHQEVKPGEVIVFDSEGARSRQIFEEEEPKLCSFEFVYTSRPDNKMHGELVYNARLEMGRELARLYPIEADFVAGMPESGLIAAQGYHEESGLPLRDAFVKNRYTGRLFIKPTEAERQNGVRNKLNPMPDIVRGKSFVLIDDSQIRADTSLKAIALLREAGAKAIHFRVSSPPYRWPCFYGMSTHDHTKLAARNMTIEEVADFIGVDSLAYLPTDRLRAAIGAEAGKKVCDACFTGNYPTKVSVQLGPPAHGDTRLFYQKATLL